MDKMDFLEKIEQALNSAAQGRVYRFIIADAEKLLIEKTLERSHGNQILAARILGLNRNTIRSKIRKLNISMEKYKA